METELVEGAAAMSDMGPGLRPAQLLDLAVTLLSTLSDLHEAGVAHGNLSADHVLVRGDDRIVLCSFGSAGTVDDDSARHDTKCAALIIAGMLSRATRFPEAEPATADLHRVTSTAVEGRRSLDRYLEDVVSIQARALAAIATRPVRGRSAGTPPTPARLPTNHTASALDATRTWRRAPSTVVVAPETPTTSPVIAVMTLTALLVVTWMITRATLGLPLVPSFISNPEIRTHVSALEQHPSPTSWP